MRTRVFAAAAILLLRSGALVEAASSPCPAGPLFDTLPMPLSEFRAFRPLGFMSYPIHVVPAWHSSFARKIPGESRPSVEVRFPGPATVESVFAIEFLASGTKGYQIRFAPCRDVTAYFNHLATLSARLLAEVGASPASCTEFNDGSGMVRNCRVSVSVAVEAGELAGVSDETAGVDFGLIDYRLPPAGFANPAHYTRDFFYYASPVGYFTQDPRDALVSRLASYDGSVPRTAEPRAGTHMQDLPGTAQGNWFTPGSSFVGASNENVMLALAHDYIDASQPVISVGGGVAGLRAGIASFTVNDEGRVNRDFAAVRADGTTYCYDSFLTGRTRGGVPLVDPGGILLVAMPTDATLAIARRGSSGSTCASLSDWTLGAAAVRFER